MRSFFQAKMKVHYQTVIDGVASVVREARELLMARKKDSVTRALPTWPTAGLWWTGCFQKQSATGIGKHASSWTSHRLVTDLRLWICASPHRLAVTGAGLVGWLAGWPACLPACLLAALLGCSVAQLLACFLVRPEGRRTRRPTQAHVWGENARQEESRLWEGGQQHRHPCGETMGDKG